MSIDMIFIFASYLIILWFRLTFGVVLVVPHNTDNIPVGFIVSGLVEAHVI